MKSSMFEQQKRLATERFALTGEFAQRQKCSARTRVALRPREPAWMTARPAMIGLGERRREIRHELPRE
jgi:hypothetical protein